MNKQEHNQTNNPADNTASASIFIIDDDASVRRSLARLLSTADYLVETYESADAFLQRLPYQSNGAIILDVNMPGLDGIALHKRLLESGCELPVIFLTGHGDIPMSVSAMKNGASDFLMKPVDEQVLLNTIAQTISSYQQSCNKQLADETIQARLATLTQREYEVMQHVIAGQRNREIGNQLGISEKTVKVHRARVMEKMDVISVAALVRICIEAGVVTEE